MHRLVWFAIAAAFGVAQEAPRVVPPKAVERFAGKILLREPQPHEISVSIHNWIIRGGQKIAALELPAKGTLLVQLRGGSLLTVIAGRRQQRKEGEFWTVPAGAAMGIETGDDSAIIQTTIISE
jgi:hypothetical protein